MTGDCEVTVAGGGLRIAREATTRKFVAEVEHRTFSGSHAALRGREVLYVTERCVFELRADGLVLTEIAPGINLERDVLMHMAFRPRIEGPRTMDARIFLDEAMGLRQRLVGLTFAARFAYDATKNVLYLNFEGLEVKAAATVDAIGKKVAELCAPLGAQGRRVQAVVNYEGFVLGRCPGIC